MGRGGAGPGYTFHGRWVGGADPFLGGCLWKGGGGGPIGMGPWRFGMLESPGSDRTGGLGDSCLTNRGSVCQLHPTYHPSSFNQLLGPAMRFWGGATWHWRPFHGCSLESPPPFHF